MIRIVDTNVLVLADQGHNHESPLCVREAIRYLLATRKQWRVGIDAGELILKEYKRNVQKDAQPGVGHAFLLYLYSNQHNPKHARRVPITSHPDREFLEFPDDPELTKFDRSDRKFVAVALASEEDHEIANAVDSDWRKGHDALSRNGVVVRYLCETA